MELTQNNLQALLQLCGIVSMGKSTSIGSITLKSMTWFITASFVSLAIGMGLANFFQPGAALDLALPTAQQLSSSSLPTTTGFTLQSFLSHVFHAALQKQWRTMIFYKSLFSLFSLVQLLLL